MQRRSIRTGRLQLKPRCGLDDLAARESRRHAGARRIARRQRANDRAGRLKRGQYPAQHPRRCRLRLRYPRPPARLAALSLASYIGQWAVACVGPSVRRRVQWRNDAWRGRGENGARARGALSATAAPRFWTVLSSIGSHSLTGRASWLCVHLCAGRRHEHGSAGCVREFRWRAPVLPRWGPQTPQRVASTKAIAGSAERRGHRMVVQIGLPCPPFGCMPTVGPSHCERQYLRKMKCSR